MYPLFFVIVIIFIVYRGIYALTPSTLGKNFFRRSELKRSLVRTKIVP